MDSPGYCNKHSNQTLIRKPFENAIGSNYSLYNTYQWKKLKKEALLNKPYCSKCGTAKDECKLDVHHIIAPRGDKELFYDKNNLEVVCSACHKLLTAREIAIRRIKAINPYPGEK